MEENQKTKANVSTIICCVIIVILLAALGGTLYYYNVVAAKNNKKVETTNTIVEQKTVTENEEKTEIKNETTSETKPESTGVKKIDESKDLVYKIKQKLDEPYIEDDKTTTEIEIPQINLDYDNIKYVNEKIRNGAKNDCYDYEINYYLNKDILSLVFKSFSIGDNYDVRVYNIDVNNGNILTNDELLHKLGRTDDIYAKVVEGVWKVVNKEIPSDTEEIYSYAKGMSVNYNTNLDIPMFINQNGKLCIVVNYTTPAGSGGPWGIITEIE